MQVVKVNKPHVLHWNSMDYLFSEWIQQYDPAVSWFFIPCRRKPFLKANLWQPWSPGGTTKGSCKACTAGTAGPLDEYAEDVSAGQECPEPLSLAWKQMLHPCRETNL